MRGLRIWSMMKNWTDWTNWSDWSNCWDLFSSKRCGFVIGFVFPYTTMEIISNPGVKDGIGVVGDDVNKPSFVTHGGG